MRRIGWAIPNEYAHHLGELFEKIPKSVLAAVAVSFAVMLRDEGTDDLRLANAKHDILKEWWTLHENGIVPQRPPGKKGSAA